MKMKDRIEELEKRVRDLEARPVWYPVPYYVAPPQPVLPYFHPLNPWAPYSGVTTCDMPATTVGQLYT